MTDKDRCRAAFEEAFDDGFSDTLRRDKQGGWYINGNTDFAWQGWRACWKNQSAALAAAQEREAKLREALQNMVTMVEGNFAPDHPYTLINACAALSQNSN